MTTIEHLESYRAVLLEHDWEFAQSMNEAHIRVNREHLMALRQAQPLVDPDCNVWNEIAPEKHQIHLVPGQPRSGEIVFMRNGRDIKFQDRHAPWLLACFGEAIASDPIERNHRFLEEALELVQACGCTASESHQLVDYVFGRPTGNAFQEAGGVMVTLAALCRANGLDMHAAGDAELARVWPLIDKIRAKQAAKPKHSPLPQIEDQREAFEDKVFNSYYIKSIIRNPNPPKGTGAMDFIPDPQMVDKKTLCARDGESYKDDAIGAMWHGWKLARGLS